MDRVGQRHSCPGRVPQYSVWQGDKMAEEPVEQSCSPVDAQTPSTSSRRGANRFPLREARSRYEPARGRSLRRAAYLTAGVGLAFAILFLLAYWLLSGIPGVEASDDEMAAFYASDARRLPILVGVYVQPFVGITFLWFIVALRMWIAAGTRHVNQLSSNIQLISGIIFIAVFFVSAAATASTAAVIQFSTAPFSPTAARLLPQLGNTLTFVFAMRMAAMFIFTTSNIGRKSKILPRWFLVFGYIVGFFLLVSAGFRSLFVLAFPVWMLLLGIILLHRASQIPADARLPRGQGIWTSSPVRDRPAAEAEQSGAQINDHQ